MPVNKERVALFTAALRSGEYKQGTGRLCTLNADGRVSSWCCLGVAADVAMKNGLSITIEDYVSMRAFDNNTALMSPAVWQWYGFANNDPSVTIGENHQPASNMNDALHKSFAEIADGFDALT